MVSGDLSAAQSLEEIAEDLGYSVGRREALGGLGMVLTRLRLPDGVSPLEAADRLRLTDRGAWVDANHRYSLQDDGSVRSYPRRLLEWPAETEQCGEGLRIGILDTGLPDAHPSLEGAAIEVRSFVEGEAYLPPPDHALAIADILVAQGGEGLVPRAELFVAEVMRERVGRRVDTTAEVLIRGLDWLVQQKVDVVNLSLGGPRNLTLELAVQRVLEAGIPVVAAAGNSGPEAEPLYPAAQLGVTAVTAVDAERNIYECANRGDHIAFSAPGVDVWLPRADGAGYQTGTSFAAPYVTATIAATRQGLSGAAWQAVFEQLTGSAEDLGESGRDPVFGFGLAKAPASCSQTGN
jgi:subtilisin family serine protease